MHKAAFLQQLQQQVQTLLATATGFNALEEAALQFKPGPESWSMLECLEHLNRYSRFYNPELAAALARPRPNTDTEEIEFTWLGRRSYELVRPENAKPSKTLARMNPGHSRLSRTVIEEFGQHQQELLGLLERANQADLNKQAVRVEFFKLLKLKTGEAFQFVVAHEQRHMQQALRMQQHYQKLSATAVAG